MDRLFHHPPPPNFALHNCQETVYIALFPFGFGGIFIFLVLDICSIFPELTIQTAEGEGDPLPVSAQGHPAKAVSASRDGGWGSLKCLSP